MRRFCWISGDEIPARYDLRKRGWSLENSFREGRSIGLYDLEKAQSRCEAGLFAGDVKQRGLVILLGVTDSDERARLLQVGHAEVLGNDASLAEIDARARGIAQRAGMIQRFRDMGALRIDMLEREAYVDGSPVHLHPREFALLWRLSDEPGRPLSKHRLLHDVWGLRMVPETNTLAVHVSRLRDKLRHFGLAWMIQTTHAGEYLLNRRDPARWQPTNPPLSQGLDEYLVERNLQATTIGAARTSADET